MQKNALRKSLVSHKNDIILGTALLLIALCLFFVFRAVRNKNGGVVQIKQCGKIVGEYNLSEDGEYEFKSLYGSNTLKIEDGKAFISDASCKDHICEDMGKISKKGEMIICLPNELFISVISGEESDYDAIVN